MILLILGVALWWAAHLFKRIAPDARARMGDAGKGAVAVALVVSIVLMVVGYRGADYIHVWSPPVFLTHLNNLLVLIAVYLFAASGMKTAIGRRLRHPQLGGFKTWAFAHLLVNGDLASIILFGGLMFWAVAEVIIINRNDPWQRPAPAPVDVAREAMAAVGTLIVYGAVAWVHTLLGYYPFGG